MGHHVCAGDSSDNAGGDNEEDCLEAALIASGPRQEQPDDQSGQHHQHDSFFGAQDKGQKRRRNDGIAKTGDCLQKTRQNKDAKNVCEVSFGDGKSRPLSPIRYFSCFGLAGESSA